MEWLWLRDEVRLLLGVALRASTLSMLEIVEEDGEFIAPGSHFIDFQFAGYFFQEIQSGINRSISYQKKKKTPERGTRTGQQQQQWNNGRLTV